MRTAFDTAFALDGLLCDFRIVRESPSRTYWMYRCHHLVADGQSVSMICRMIVDLYNRRTSADMARIEPTPSYFDSLDDDRKYAESSRYERDAQFWQDKFSSLPPPLLSSRSSEAAARPASFPDGQVNLTIERAKYDRLGRIAEASGCTIVHVMFGVLALYFSRAFQVDEVVIGMPVHNRSTAQQKRAIGMFASVVPIRIPVDGNERFVSLLNGVSAELRHCYRHQSFSDRGVEPASGARANRSQAAFRSHAVVREVPARFLHRRRQARADIDAAPLRADADHGQRPGLSRGPRPRHAVQLRRQCVLSCGGRQHWHAHRRVARCIDRASRRYAGGHAAVARRSRTQTGGVRVERNGA
ncbi:condensation domain protein [Burkholderia pseudomallei MSHR3335]|nr:condensation domain protein [Burkholderia pseudomallei MSHR3335]